MKETKYKPPLERLSLDKYELSEQLNINLDELSFEDNVINKVNILITGHFGNCVSLAIECRNCHPLGLYNNTGNVGYLLRFLIEFFDKSKDESVSFETLNNTEICLVFEEKGYGKCVAIGNKEQTKFFIIKDFIIIND